MLFQGQQCMLTQEHIQLSKIRTCDRTGTGCVFWYLVLFWYHLGRGSKWSVPLSKRDIKTPLITDWQEKIFITVSLNLRLQTQHRPARFKSAQPAKDRTQFLFEQTHLFVSTKKWLFRGLLRKYRRSSRW